MRNNILEEYFEWLYDLVSKDRNIAYRRLLTYLSNTPFIYSLQKDENRAKDGLDLRLRFGFEIGELEDVTSYIKEPCSVLEMMVALAIRCEESIMDDPDIGDRTSQWFWNMIVNLGLGSMSDDRFDSDFVNYVIDRFLNREYEPDGRGGLFTIRNCEYDLRTVEIWHQLCWYLDSIV